MRSLSFWTNREDYYLGMIKVFKQTFANNEKEKQKT